MRLLSISAGKVAPLFSNDHPNYKSVASAIRKKVVSSLENSTPIEITSLGVKGDEQADLSVHGGIEKAIYVYPAEHYAFWNELLTRETKRPTDLQYGAIGENFTIEGLLETEIFIGDRLKIGELEFTVVKLREPCFKFNAAVGYKGASKAMLQSGFSGWYLRVLKTGLLSAGAVITLTPGPRETSIAQQNQKLLSNRNQKDLWE
ncbi:MOSC domain-containing protein [Polynucleobacter sp. JS-Safj-400b-B2]|uniref:MOSC domain-containing protein n=1 Tax=Polynucleobacter sp. JS-Safj-400b-B2 TaxID=2576921 RepID=UPI001C0D6A1D|nr:MOSC domain-containing protein [Polynucleobacter sp. JS-Safj-400b-B2]MBU3625386.1 MOSC domain-containing protein [Polynucleobacter sp. JS-Safj-400b-B2]